MTRTTLVATQQTVLKAPAGYTTTPRATRNLPLRTEAYVVCEACWPDDEPAIRRIRHAVFVVEQGVPPRLEWDGRDPHCTHILARSRADKPIGTARMLPEGRIGRMAVAKPWRRRGVGSALLNALIDLAMEQDVSRLVLHSQIQVVPFYQHHGFHAAGAEFFEAGIAHRKMCRGLTT